MQDEEGVQCKAWVAEFLYLCHKIKYYYES